MADQGISRYEDDTLVAEVDSWGDSPEILVVDDVDGLDRSGRTCGLS
jgi:hypothetical protein